MNQILPNNGINIRCSTEGITLPTPQFAPVIYPQYHIWWCIWNTEYQLWSIIFDLVEPDNLVIWYMKQFLLAFISKFNNPVKWYSERKLNEMMFAKSVPSYLEVFVLELYRNYADSASSEMCYNIIYRYLILHV